MAHKKTVAKKVAVLAVMATLLICVKQALNPIANVELVSLLSAVFGYSFGLIVVIPVTVFCLVECLIWGFGSWFFAYIIYFNLIVIIFTLLKKRKIENRFVICLITIGLTFFFGLLTAFFDIVLIGFKDFFYRFIIYYSGGIFFYLVHILSNAIIFLFLFKPLVKLKILNDN